MSTRDDLEASLRARPDDATLTVYADLLQAQGDPRGELITLDLYPPAMSTHGLETRRGQLLEQWLGDDIDVQFDRDQQLWYAGDLGTTFATFDCGFIEIVVDDAADEVLIARLLAGRAGEFLRRLSLAGPTALLDPILDGVAARQRPWLQHLALRRPAHEVPRLSVDKLAAATPNLEVLDLSGRKMLDRFTHPNLRELGITGSEAIDLVDGPPLPALKTIDYAFDGDRPVPLGLFAPDRVPALRRLAFSREEPGGRLLAELGLLRVASQITHLVLPSLRSSRDRELVQAGIDRMERLREVSIARAYLRYGPFAGELRHANARIRVAEAWPWPPSEVVGDAVVTIDGYSMNAIELIRVLEDQYDQLPEEVRAIWYRFWSLFREPGDIVYGRDPEHAFLAGDVVRALDAMALDEDLASLATHLRTRIAQRGSFFATISASR